MSMEAVLRGLKDYRDLPGLEVVIVHLSVPRPDTAGPVVAPVPACGNAAAAPPPHPLGAPALTALAPEQAGPTPEPAPAEPAPPEPAPAEPGPTAPAMGWEVLGAIDGDSVPWSVFRLPGDEACWRRGMRSVSNACASPWSSTSTVRLACLIPW